MASSSMQPFDHNRYGPKMGGCAPLGEGELGVGSPSNTMWPGRRPTSVPCFVLIRPTVWPLATVHQRCRQRDRQDRQRSHRIGRTVLQTVAAERRCLLCVLWAGVCGEGFMRVNDYTPCGTYVVARMYVHCAYDSVTSYQFCARL